MNHVEKLGTDLHPDGERGGNPSRPPLPAPGDPARLAADVAWTCSECGEPCDGTNVREGREASCDERGWFDWAVKDYYCDECWEDLEVKRVLDTIDIGPCECSICLWRHVHGGGA